MAVKYKRTHWYGLSYFLHVRGSLVPRALPAMFVSGAIFVVLFLRVLDPYVGWDLSTFFDDPFSMQMYGLVFGFLSINRLAQCYNRYWEGVSEVVTMYSKWLECAAQVISFDRIDDASTDVSQEPFVAHIVRLFVQLSTMAMLSLHSGAATDADWQALIMAGVALSQQPSTAPTRRRSLLEPLPRRPSLVAGMDSPFTTDEIARLRRCACPVALTIDRIHRALTTRQRARGWMAPAPVYSPVYQQLLDGFSAFRAARKMKTVPVPFGFVQLCAMLLIGFVILTPVAIACFSSTISMGLITTLVTVGGFVAMWLVANEMEDPFGIEANHLDLREFHADFVSSLSHFTEFDQRDIWTVGKGAWKRHSGDTFDVDVSAWPGLDAKSKALADEGDVAESFNKALRATMVAHATSRSDAMGIKKAAATQQHAPKLHFYDSPAHPTINGSNDGGIHRSDSFFNENLEDEEVRGINGATKGRPPSTKPHLAPTSPHSPPAAAGQEDRARGAKSRRRHHHGKQRERTRDGDEAPAAEDHAEDLKA